jgi:hypothetical protein
MAAKNGTILSLLINAPCRVGAPLFAFLLLSARHTISRFQSGIVLVRLVRKFVQQIQGFRFIRRHLEGRGTLLGF